MVAGQKYVRVAYNNFHEWLIPARAVIGISCFGLLFIFIGIVLLAIGRGLSIGGGILLGIGLLCLFVCFLLCLHSCFVLNLTDQETQTTDAVYMAKNEPDFIPTYAVIDKKPPPSPVKADSRNNTLLKKQVTISPTVDQRGTTIPIQTGPPMHSPPPYGHPNPPYQGQGSNLQYQGQGPNPPYQGQGIHYEYAKPAQQVTYSFPMRSQQPTPYSTLSQRQPQPYMMQGQQGFNFAEDYDNPQEVTPMMHQQQKWRTNDDDLPEPQPLVYPSAKRPMTFEQTSSSKVSIYDNVQFGLDKIDD